MMIPTLVVRAAVQTKGSFQKTPAFPTLQPVPPRCTSTDRWEAVGELSQAALPQLPAEERERLPWRGIWGQSLSSAQRFTEGMLGGRPREESPAGLECPLEQPCRTPHVRDRAHTELTASISLKTMGSAWEASGVQSTNFQTRRRLCSRTQNNWSCKSGFSH